MASRGLARLPAAGARVSRADVRHLVDRLAKMTPKQRREVPGLNPDRVDIIVPGLGVIDSIMRRFRVNTLQVHAYGVRDGLLLGMIDRLQGGQAPNSPSLDDQIDRFAEACGVDLAHSRQVARLAAEIYDGLRPVLRAAAGRSTAARSRGAHAGRRLPHQLRGAPQALVPSDPAQPAGGVSAGGVGAGRQRGPLPPRRRAEEQARELSADSTRIDQLRVRQMAAMLRLAGGLDRSHNQIVRSVAVAGTPDNVELMVAADEFPEVDLWAAQRRADVFEKVFDAELKIEWAGERAAACDHSARRVARERRGQVVDQVARDERDLPEFCRRQIARQPVHVCGQPRRVPRVEPLCRAAPQRRR